MKKLFTLAIMMISLSSFSQDKAHLYVSAGLDIRNALVGSKATNQENEADMAFKFGMVSNYGVEAVIGYELFPAIDYDRMYFGAGYQFDIAPDFVLVPTIEPSIIHRHGDWGGGIGYEAPKSSHLSVGLSTAVRFNISDSFAVEVSPNILLRTDIDFKYGSASWSGFTVAGIPTVVSYYFNLMYKF